MRFVSVMGTLCSSSENMTIDSLVLVVDFGPIQVAQLTQLLGLEFSQKGRPKLVSSPKKTEMIGQKSH